MISELSFRKPSASWWLAVYARTGARWESNVVSAVNMWHWPLSCLLWWDFYLLPCFFTNALAVSQVTFSQCCSQTSKTFQLCWMVHCLVSRWSEVEHMTWWSTSVSRWWMICPCSTRCLPSASLMLACGFNQAWGGLWPLSYNMNYYYYYYGWWWDRGL